MAQGLEQPATQCVECGKTHRLRVALIPSPFQSIIAHELMPTASETVSIRDFICETDAEIAWRRRAIARLACEINELHRRSEQHNAIIAPIRRVPPEIMMEIFLQLTEMERRGDLMRHFGSKRLFTDKYVVRPRPHRTPMIFGEVSRGWRAIALSMPRLWNSIFLHCRNKNMQNNISLCDTWLKRSGSLPLSIHFYRKSSSPVERVEKDTIDGCKELIRTILPYAKRWRFVHLERLPPSSYDVFRGIHSTPRLETLTVSYDGKSTVTDSIPWAGLQFAPNLRLLYSNRLVGPVSRAEKNGPYSPGRN
ncbi:hypothetical protein B0H19DRAFT_249142 [Mycena capillaripes]|nr:hypothetical protein B0H19DRAFT_249142 [Mycena capillaripes]